MAIPIRKANPKPLPLSSQDLQTLARDATNATRLKQTLDYLVGAVSEALAEKSKQDGTVFAPGPGQATPVVGAYGVRTVPLAGRTVAIGMMVREDGGSIVPASNATISTYGAATAFVTEVSKDGVFAKIASGAASAPLLVTSPEIGESVYLAANGNGTCDLASLVTTDPNALSQVVAVCEDIRLDASGCVRCSSISFGGAQVEYVDKDGYLRRNVDNAILTSPTADPTSFTGSAVGYLLSLTNTGSGGGWLITCDGGSSVTAGIRIDAVLSKPGVIVLSESGTCFSGSNFSAGPAAQFYNTDTASGSFHLLLGDQGTTAFNGIDVWQNSIRFYGATSADTLIITPTNSGSWGSLTQTFQAASGTIALLSDITGGLSLGTAYAFDTFVPYL